MEDIRRVLKAFLARYPYCYGYWKKYSDLEKKRGTAELCNEVRRLRAGLYAGIRPTNGPALSAARRYLSSHLAPGPQSRAAPARRHCRAQALEAVMQPTADTLLLW